LAQMNADYPAWEYRSQNSEVSMNGINNFSSAF